MGPLSIAQYDQAEEQALSYLPNRVVEAYRLVVFGEFGYPTRVKNPHELCKFVDVMQENRFDFYINRVLAGITSAEFELLKRATTAVWEYSKAAFGKGQVARSTVLQALNVLRHIRYLYGDARPRVFEMGPGSGLLGTLLLLEGHAYIGLDPCQALYLHQNHLWNFVTSGRVTEGVESAIVPSTIQNLSNGECAHLPWWQFVEMTPENVAGVDIVTCNHALCEMHQHSARFSILMAEAMLKGPRSDKKLFVFEGWGYAKESDRARITQAFYEFGMVLVYQDDTFVVFSRKGSEFANGALSLPKEKRHGSISYQDGQLVMGESKVQSYEPENHQASPNPITDAIVLGRERAKPTQTIGGRELHEFYRTLAGTSDYQSADERFWSLIRYNH